MIQAWRMVKPRHVATAFSGEGAAKYGGRWNLPGIPVVYASGSRALAILELRVHLNPPVPLRHVIFPIQFEESLLERLSLAALPSDWISQPPAPSTQQLGSVWAASGRSAVIEVPSVLVPGEPNYLLNPVHPDFQRIR
ncbi:MAG: RES family NAD+ phosphorylase, partial [Verrucomicrobiae bacterium]|nr:RES family NAD+ phosphorylase [Verrucomicrobiae bacterium]